MLASFSILGIAFISSYGWSSEFTGRISGVNIDHTLEDRDYSDIYEYGFRYVRISFPRMPFYKGERFPNELVEDAYKIFDRNIELARKYRLKVIVDPHYFPGMEKLYSMRPSDQFWRKIYFQESVIKFWSDFAKRHRENGDVIYAYDLLNEPSPPARVFGQDRCEFLLEFYNEIIEAVRQYDQQVKLIIQFPMALNTFGKSTNQLDAARCFPARSWVNVIYSFHMYDPGRFTHQGVGDFKSPTMFYGALGEDGAKAYLRKRLQVVRSWQDEVGAEILVGEFGASRSSGAEGDRYISDLLDLFDEFEWGWIFHSFREAQVWDPEIPNGNSVPGSGMSDAPRIRALSKAASRRLSAD